ncbi:MAG: hypothetical protein GY812_09125 [Actinomycetia bacterium]|nr:hypothetical protein [Actinomycetes bacterium]
MQTLEPYVEPESGKPPRRGSTGALAALGALVIVATSVAAVVTRLGVLVIIGVAIIAVGALFVLRRGFGFVQLVAFLIHFEGIGRGGISVGRIISATAILLIAYKLVVDKWRPPAVPMRYWLPPVLVMTWGVASAIWAPDVGQWFVGVGVFGLAFAYFATSALLIDSVDLIKKWMRAYWYGGICGAVAGVWGLILGLRAFGFNRDANLFGVLAASMIPLTIYYRRQSKTTTEKVLYTVVLLLVLGGAAGAGSRSGVIGAAVALFASMVYRPGVKVSRNIARAFPAAIITAIIAVGLIVINPNTLIRGTDSSGRLDFWNVSVSMIQERPVLGVGLGNLDAQIPSRMPITPGTTKLSDVRDEVSSHNTYLDIAGDLGVIGLVIWASAIVMTVIGLLRPRWKQTKELSGYLFLMFLPVLSGSMFLSLINNKLAWSLIGIAAALQVPSWGTRWKGYFEPSRGDPASGEEQPERLARWDLRISQRFRIWVVLGALAGAVIFPVVGSSAPTNYSASRSIVVPKLDLPPGVPYVRLDIDRLQYVHNLILSDAYAYQLAELAGVDIDPRVVSDDVTVFRSDAGPYMDIVFKSTDEQLVNQVAPHLTGALDAIIEQGRIDSEETLRDELRPRDPGEQRYYTGPMYLPVGQDVDFGVEPPRLVWLAFVGAGTGGLLAISLVLIKQGSPRVNNDDDFPHAVGMPLWTHVGRNGRRNAATPAQYAHVAVTAFEATDGERLPNRMLLAAPRHSRSARVLSMGIAASLAASGERVLLVDGQVERRVMSWRLGAGLAPGMNDIAHGRAALGDSIRRVRRWRLPRPVRKSFRDNRENLRFIPAGRPRRGEEPAVDPALLSDVDDDVIIVMLAPPLLGTIPVSPSLRWADVVLYNLVEGETVTSDAEDAALQVATFAQGPSGVVLSDV